MQLVVARFHEDLSAFMGISYPRAIMNMGKPLLNLSTDDNVTIKQIGNAGHESYAYLKWIEFNKGHLREFPCVVFLQGDPRDHLINFDDPQDRHLSVRLKRIEAAFRDGADFMLVTPTNTWRSGEGLPKLVCFPCADGRMRYPRCPQVRYAIDPERPWRPLRPLEDAWEFIYGDERPMPKHIRWPSGCMFAVSGGLLYSRARDVLEPLLKLVEHDPLPMEASTLERLWPAILGRE